MRTSIPLFRPRQSTVAPRAEMTIFLLLFVKEIIIIIIMNGSCIAPILPSRKLNVLTHTIHANIHTDRHKHNLPLPPPHTHTYIHIMVHLDLWKCLLKKEIFELGFEIREGGKIPQTGRQRIPDSWGNETERAVRNRFEIAFRDFQQFLARRSGSA